MAPNKKLPDDVDKRREILSTALEIFVKEGYFSTTGASIVGCAHIGIGDTCTGTANENFGYVAIDFTAVNLDKFASGEISISVTSSSGEALGTGFVAGSISSSTTTDGPGATSV